MLETLINDLQRPEAYDHPADSVETRQTHISVLFFAGDFVYKVKKPLQLGFLDFSTLEKRRHFCEEEVRLNRRLAPETYLGVTEITRDASGRLRIGGNGEAVECAVHMRRLPAERMLDQLLESGEAAESDIDRIADLLVPFHAKATAGEEVRQHGSPESVRQRVTGNLDELERAVQDHLREDCVFNERLLKLLRVAQRRFVNDHDDLLAKRVKDGRIREGHGDLHSANICLLDDRVVIYDCIEFSFPFRCCDVACDLAFLAMDLAFRGRADLRARLIERYAAASDDAEMATLVPFYERHYALVRAKVNIIESAEPETADDARSEARETARRYALYAAASAAAGSMVLVCGLPGAGKSWLAGRVAPILCASWLRSDVVRKELAGVALHEQAADSIYTDAWTKRTYEALRDRAAAELDAGRSVIIDANFPTASMRRPFIELARSREASITIVHVTASDEAIRQRLAERQRLGAAISDADVEVYESARRRFEPPDEVPPEHLLSIQSPCDPPSVAGRIAERLLAARYESS